VAEFTSRNTLGKERTPQRSAAADALRLLARRPHTLTEMRQRLERLGHTEPDVATAVAKLSHDGYLDDGALALNYIVTRAVRKCQGHSRLIRELEQRGVKRAVAEQAWHEAVESGDVQPDELLVRAVQRQLDRHGTELDVRRYRRVYNALLRAGFDASRVIVALKSHRLHDYPDAGPAGDELE
jgi:regulatory protein